MESEFTILVLNFRQIIRESHKARKQTRNGNEKGKLHNPRNKAHVWKKVPIRRETFQVNQCHKGKGSESKLQGREKLYKIKNKENENYIKRYYTHFLTLLISIKIKIKRKG